MSDVYRIGIVGPGLAFATRRDDGAYVADVLDEATRNSAHARVERVYGEAVALTPVPDGVRLQLV